MYNEYEHTIGWCIFKWMCEWLSDWNERETFTLIGKGIGNAICSATANSLWHTRTAAVSFALFISFWRSATNCHFVRREMNDSYSICIATRIGWIVVSMFIDNFFVMFIILRIRMKEMKMCPKMVRCHKTIKLRTISPIHLLTSTENVVVPFDSHSHSLCECIELKFTVNKSK